MNIPTLKAHKHAGLTLFAKNHFGSQTRDNAVHLHGGLVAPEENNPRRQGYSLYRVQVDLMGHKLLGGKELLYILDALWSADYEIGPPRKWTMPPFNNDWTSSIIVSLDPVAIESVGFDLLRAEFTPERGLRTYPQMIGVDDYLHQAADSTFWPEGIIYDPENDGTPLPSLGVHEHWNNPIDKQYSKNLGLNNGIELIYVNPLVVSIKNTILHQNPESFTIQAIYPNPFNTNLSITYEVYSPCHIRLVIYDLMGNLVETLVDQYQQPGIYTVKWMGYSHKGETVPSGVYFCCSLSSSKFQKGQIAKILLLR